ncbi:DUF6233 domain-containing protein [Streptomyces venezuelae]|uniref:DUF6233 domain-containing protein n=1 Tax=Streptomyces venezuelae TaxID=54571 RepID=UPI0034410E3A
MSDQPAPSRLEKLRIVEGFLRHQLGQVEKWIAEEQQRQAEQRRGEQARPPVPDWILEVGIGADKLPVAVHVGGCHMSGKRTRGIPRDQAVRALTEGVGACSHCRPDTALGVLE